MMCKLKKLLNGERGITGLETAIILVAFVVVAAVFSFAVLSAGTFATQKSEEAVYAGLSEVRSTIERRGSVVAYDTASDQDVDEIRFTIANVAGGEAVDLTTGSNRRMVVDYHDEDNRNTDLTWTKTWMGANDGDHLLEEGEMAEIVVTLSTTPVTNTNFALEVKPETGAVLRLEKRTPSYMDAVMVLD